MNPPFTIKLAEAWSKRMNPTKALPFAIKQHLDGENKYYSLMLG